MNYIPPKKSLGQNFLKSRSAIHTLITSVGAGIGDTIIEVGPGKGALTLPILETGARVIAFELDERMIEELSSSLSSFIESGHLVLVHRDILEIDIDDYILEGQTYKVIANIPYYITSAIIRKFLESPTPPTAMSLLMQKEVAERIVVRDGKESILSLSVSIYGAVRYLGKVSRTAFSPPPKVDSAMVLFTPYSKPVFEHKVLYEKFFSFIKCAFSQKRKQVINNLELLMPRKVLEGVFVKRNLPLTIRAEKIKREDWEYIVHALKDYSF
jgi:16S rRNA (adenine1518-N6/adenine1519-N6)-dimethyltransferase